MGDSASSSLGEANNRPLRAWTMAANSDAIDRTSRSMDRSSIDSSERPKSQGGDAADSAKTGLSGFSKLISSRRKKKNKKHSDELQGDATPITGIALEHSLSQSQSNDSRSSASGVQSSDTSSAFPETDGINLLTDDSEPERTPPLTSRNSHTGFYTLSSPLIKAAPVDADNTTTDQINPGSAVSGVSAAESEPTLVDAGEHSSRPGTRSSMTLDVPADASSKRRSSSPGRRIKEVLGTSDKKNSNTKDDASVKSGSSKSGRSLFNSRRSSLSAKRASAASDAPPPLPQPIRTDLVDEQPRERTLQASPLPKTPPHTAVPAPETTITPPTPTDHRPLNPTLISNVMTDSPDSIKSRASMSGPEPGITISPSGTMISHRRARSASAAHVPSKLSTSVTALSPLEEAKTPKVGSGPQGGQGGFFSSVFSVAQNAATSLSNTLNSQQKSRTNTPAANQKGDNSNSQENNEPSDHTNKGEEQQPTTVETLGSGNLNFSHLGIENASGEGSLGADGGVTSKQSRSANRRRKPTMSERDEEAARLEHQRAARAVHQAYEKPESSVVGSPSDDTLDVQSTVSLSRESAFAGDQTPPSGSVIDGDIGSGSVRRTGSVRSRLARRHRGSSGATASTIGAIGASALALGVPGANASVHRLTGFAVASKKRNRDFHQLFRSVPEDDFLIEDYSCALQREIILAGRIYISEGHICFSSNILGWVTTLVISFDEIVAVEKENTAMVFPNAIAIQTLHARHTFRSLLSRESTYDLMVNIWKINHPSLKSSVNGTRVTDGTGDKTEKIGEADSESEESDEDEVYDEDEEGDMADSFFEAGTSANASERSLIGRGGLSRQASGNLATSPAPATASNGNTDAKNGEKPAASKEADFPGPATHAPTEYTEPDGQYEKVIKDEVIPAPLGKVYTLVFGPASGDFMTKFLVDNQKSGELHFEGTSKGLSNDNRNRKYSYIKPLSGSIGPKQTKCISTETLDFLDLEKAVLVTLSTQTPDVPSGNVFATKTKYLFTWAPNNQTRFLMTCTIEWTGKSWLKGPIEKGAIDGQTSFGTELLKTLKVAVVPRGRTNGATKGKGRRKKGGSASSESAPSADSKPAVDSAPSQNKIWGIPQPQWIANVAILIVVLLLYLVFFRAPFSSTRQGHDAGFSGLNLPQRLAAYEEMWHREESELWNWLEDRVGMDGMTFPVVSNRDPDNQTGRKSFRISPAAERDLISRIRDEQVSDREMDHAIRTTRQRLDVLEQMMSNRKAERVSASERLQSEL
ncbi:GRAM domain membrane-associated protein [Penicillium ucsense]|uniref:GRAM domain membrane-associated protein n=1 Tax=Penicillium ucsense TaxID=2839758 RepID=A0A8J8W4Y3_9EURO|nr:GRAM domain membrane-associated protein [Penicillium ucsense]